MKRILLIFLLVLCLLSVALRDAPSAAGQSDYWGALAYSNATGRYGFAYDYPTQAQAINKAVVKCGIRDCRGVVWFHNGCGAFARGSGVWGWAIGDTRADAEERAIAECRKHGGGCRAIAWACTTR
jgi:serine/threonine-protein kinase